MQIIINSAEELIDLRKALCVYRKRRQLSIDSIQRLREKTRASIDWASDFIEQINLQIQ